MRGRVLTANFSKVRRRPSRQFAQTSMFVLIRKIVMSAVRDLRSAVLDLMLVAVAWVSCMTGKGLLFCLYSHDLPCVISVCIRFSARCSPGLALPRGLHINSRAQSRSECPIQ